MKTYMVSNLLNSHRFP